MITKEKPGTAPSGHPKRRILMPYEMYPPFLAVLSEPYDEYQNTVPRQWILRNGRLVVPLKRIGRDTFNPLPAKYSTFPVIACFAEQYLPYGGIVRVCDEQGGRIRSSPLTHGLNLPREILGWYSVSDRPIMTVIALPKTEKGPMEIKIIRRTLEVREGGGYIIGREKLCEMTEPSRLPSEFMEFKRAVDEAYSFIPK